MPYDTDCVAGKNYVLSVLVNACLKNRLSDRHYDAERLTKRKQSEPVRSIGLYTCTPLSCTAVQSAVPHST